MPTQPYTGYLSDVSFNLLAGAVSSYTSSTKSKKASKPLMGWPRTCLWCLPLFDLLPNCFTFEAIRLAGSGFQQTVRLGGWRSAPGCHSIAIGYMDNTGCQIGYNRGCRTVIRGPYRAVGGASIPISCVLNVLITGKRYSSVGLVQVRESS